ncbi:endo alpha-1,4 polygalactosaminidase [Marinobacter confluentis]|uniref:Polysaccharide biosynthesis protein n=1 Tax=Marinobacter confluentis TaxID=1697557 RepID=A0A4Z1BX98_9GAMM|nr:endo alpha-1,4 polygalactosaminidase [Marinobacter confluentis]TGN39240.1 polysaccharide biosynthesis protein [Marinobacter confluentis]
MTKAQKLIIALTLLLLSQWGSAAVQQPNIAFYYGNEAPIGSLMAYDWVVLQQDQASDARIDLLDQAGSLPIAYVSIGEMARSHRYFRDLKPSWLIGKNPSWSSVVLDLRLPEVRNFLLDKLIDPAFERDFQGVFLDTLDSFVLAPDIAEQTGAFAEAQRQLISAIRQRHPASKIILNRGFHLPDSVMNQVDGLALESWRNGYNAENRTYYQIPDNDRQWLDSQLKRWREARPGMPLIAIDYVADPARAGELADQLRDEGFVPWVANPSLTRLSPSQPAQIKRHLLVIHDLPEHNMDRSAAHRFAGIVLERSGYVPHYHSSLNPLPQEPVDDRYAGILVWWEAGDRPSGLCNWLAQQQQKGVPVVLMGQVPGNASCAGVLSSGIPALPVAPLTYSTGHASVGSYEGKRLPSLTARPMPQASNHTPWLTIIDDQDQQFDPVYTHSGGGVAAAPYIFEPGPDDQALWLFDPFAFFRQAFGGQQLPAIDTTTENGRRILTAHLDGDGFVSRGEFPGSPLSAEIIQDEILSRYEIPHTVSVIEAETSPRGLYPGASEAAERLARSIFQMDSVEVASHTYSHPFFWQSMEGGPAPRLENTLYGYFMNIPDYQASLAREIGGSVSYINQRLAPADKPVSVFLWTGDARPGTEALRRVREAGLVNINGGNTRPLPYASELTATWPDARPVGDELQVYAPVMNENVYTNEWTGPFYGFRDVIDTFRILEEKGRVKPMGIYYHFYSGTKPEALNALHEVYRYATSQPVIPLYLSDYAKRVQTLYYSAMMRSENGAWSWRGIGQPRTVTIGQDQYPDLEKSTGVAGYHDVAGNRYVHLTGVAPRLFLRSELPEGPRLVQANGTLTQWKREDSGGRWQITLGLNSHQAIEFSLAGTTQCRIDNTAARMTRNGSNLRITLPARRIDKLTLECQ